MRLHIDRIPLCCYVNPVRLCKYCGEPICDYCMKNKLGAYDESHKLRKHDGPSGTLCKRRPEKQLQNWYRGYYIPPYDNNEAL